MPVYLYYGDEPYLIEQAVARLRQETVNPAMASLCHKVINKPSLGDVLEAVGGVSLALGGNMLIELREFAFLGQAAKDTATEKQLEELKNLLESVEPTKTLLFCGGKVDSKIKFAKWFVSNKGFQVQKFEKLKFWETEKAVDFVRRYSQEHQVNLAHDAAELLVEQVGLELRLLAGEVDVLSLYAPGQTLTIDIVKKRTTHHENIFELVYLALSGNIGSAQFRQLDEMLLKRHPVELFAGLQSYFNTIFRVVYLHHHRHSPDAIAMRTGQKPFTVKKHIQQYSRIPFQRLRDFKHRLVDLEWKAKTGQLEGGLALEMALGSL